LAVPIPMQRFLLVKQTCDDGNDVSDYGTVEFSIIF
jgi:hypothetical protein